MSTMRCLSAHDRLRTVLIHSTPRRVTERLGVEIRRAFPEETIPSFDPFVLLDDFFLTPPGDFPCHPHMGFEKVTYLLQGELLHQDSLGNEARLEASGAHRLTAGSHVYHSETPNPHFKRTRGIQLWVNLPQECKEMTPSFQSTRAEAFPIHPLHGKGTKIVIVGDDSPLTLHSPAIVWEVALETATEVILELPDFETCFVYILAGQGQVAETLVEEGNLLVLSTHGDVRIASHYELRALVVAGPRQHQEIYLWGPYVESYDTVNNVE